MQASHHPFMQLLGVHVQYVVPRWQRRYAWGSREIDALLADLRSVGSRPDDVQHYAGALLTCPQPGPAGALAVHRVVDGQQRLVTVSLVYARLAELLGTDGQSGEWTAALIRDTRLFNTGSPGRPRKLRLQNGDEDEYAAVIGGDLPTGVVGPVSAAWRHLGRHVGSEDVDVLLRGLARLRVVSIGLGSEDDPQQIFESLNATGRPLTEGEKMKSWLLLGLDDEEQAEVYRSSWMPIERALASAYEPARLDYFLRDYLRMSTGNLVGIGQVYEALRRHFVEERLDRDRASLCRRLAVYAKEYGYLLGVAPHSVPAVERELRHLRAFGFDVHRPFSLRLLVDAASAGSSADVLPGVLRLVGTWVTRLWLADRPPTGLNRAFSDLAQLPGPALEDSWIEYWREQLARLGGTKLAVPGDEEVLRGIRTRRAYGGSAGRSSLAVLAAMMEEEQPGEAPARERLTLEHILPQRLSSDWALALSADPAEAASVHTAWSHTLPNLALLSDVNNAKAGVRSFEAKKAEAYTRSGVAMTRALCEVDRWDVDALEARARDLGARVRRIWPWKQAQSASPVAEDGNLRWRLAGGPWREAPTAAAMVLGVVAALLDRDESANAERMSGAGLYTNVHRAGSHTDGNRPLRPIPGHDAFIVWPYARDYEESRMRVIRYGERCGVLVEVEGVRAEPPSKRFWRLFAREHGPLPRQNDGWRGPQQVAAKMRSGDEVRVHIGNPEWVWIYVRVSSSHADPEAAAREWVARIRRNFPDQVLGDNAAENVKQGWTMSILKAWDASAEDTWAEVGRWIVEQVGRLIDVDAREGSGGEAGPSRTAAPASVSAVEIHGHRFPCRSWRDALAVVGRELISESAAFDRLCKERPEWFRTSLPPAGTVSTYLQLGEEDRWVLAHGTSDAVLQRIRMIVGGVGLRYGNDVAVVEHATTAPFDVATTLP